MTVAMSGYEFVGRGGCWPITFIEWVEIHSHLHGKISGYRPGAVTDHVAREVSALLERGARRAKLPFKKEIFARAAKYFAEGSCAVIPIDSEGVPY